MKYPNDNKEAIAKLLFRAIVAIEDKDVDLQWGNASPSAKANYRRAAGVLIREGCELKFKQGNRVAQPEFLQFDSLPKNP